MKRSIQAMLALLVSLAAVCTAHAQVGDAGAQPAARKQNPVLLLGRGEGFYGYLERRWIVNEILTARQLIFDQDNYVSATKWGDYSVVVLCNHLDELSDPKEVVAAEQFTKNGGRLLLLGTALRPLDFRTRTDLAWLGAAGSQTASEAPAEVIAGDARAPKQKADLIASAVMPPYAITDIQPNAVKLIGSGSNIVAYANDVGKGDVVFIGREFFRARLRENKEDRPIGGDALRDWIGDLLISGGAITSREFIHREFQKSKVDRPLAWYRDPGETARGAAYFRNPYPSPGEALKQISLEMGIGEYESFPVYVTSPIDVDDFKVRVSDLRSGDHVLPRDRFRVRQQGKVKEDLNAGPFWLLDPADAAAPTFKLKANTATTFWFTFDTAGLAPGDYKGNVQIGDATTPIQVTVWPVKLPGREYFEAQATFIWNSLGADPRQATPGGKPLDYTVFKKHLANLAAHHISYNADGYWANQSIKNAVIKESGEKLETAIKAKRVDIKNLPALDFSVFNEFVDTGIRNGMPFYHYLFKNHPGDWLHYAKAITGDDYLEPNSPEHLAVKRWLLDQTTQYLRDRGVQRLVSFLADEIGNDEVDEAVERAKLMKAGGLMPMVTVTIGPGQSPEMMKRLQDILDVWIFNAAILQSAQQIVAKDPSIVERGDLQYTYTADWHSAPYMFNRVRGPYSAHHRLDGWLIHGYLRWYPNGGAVFGMPDGPVDTEGWEGARDGIEDGRYLSRLFHLMDVLKDDPAAKTAIAGIRERSKHWIGEDPQSLVQLLPVTTPSKSASYLEPHSTLTGARQIKREALAALAELEPLSKAEPRVMVGETALVQGSKLLAGFEGPPAIVEEFRTRLAKKANVPALQPASAAKVRICMSSGNGEGVVKQLLADGKLGITKLYPAAGEFLIHRVPARDDGEETIVIYGRDAEGLKKGVDQFSALLELRTR